MQVLLVLRHVWRGDDNKLMIKGVQNTYFNVRRDTLGDAYTAIRYYHMPSWNREANGGCWVHGTWVVTASAQQGRWEVDKNLWANSKDTIMTYEARISGLLSNTSNSIRTCRCRVGYRTWQRTRVSVLHRSWQLGAIRWILCSASSLKCLSHCTSWICS